MSAAKINCDLFMQNTTPSYRTKRKEIFDYLGIFFAKNYNINALGAKKNCI